jgi:4-azaleucine resistance transporter AzlC
LKDTDTNLQKGNRPPRDFARGVLATAPLVPGVVAIGLLYGMMARQVSFSPWEAWMMSAVVHAGSAQFAALGMWGSTQASLIVITTLVINLRHMLMGASIAPYLRHLPPRWKALLALWLTDESYALAIAEYQRGRGNHYYFLGANLGVYLSWPLSGLLGAWLGTAIPDPARYGLDLIFPLGFLGLLMAFLKDRSDVAVALVSAGLALLGVIFLPGKWYVIVAGLLGSSLGLLVGRGEEGT